MSAQHIFDHAPLGSIIAYSDGAPRPPDRFANKLKAWKTNNGTGGLVRKARAFQRGSWSSPASITLTLGNFSSGGIVVMTFQTTHSVTSALEFTILRRPEAGSVLVLQPWGHSVELLHVAANEASAETWRRDNRHPDAMLEEASPEAASSVPHVGRVA